MSRPDIAQVLDIDPELAEALPPEEFDSARRLLVARVCQVGEGPWQPHWRAGEHPALGLLVLEGLLTRQVSVAGRPTTELLGPGDLLRPWDEDAELGVPTEVAWRVLEGAQLAVLDGRFLQAAVRWPLVLDALTARALRRSRGLAFQMATQQITRVEGRLLVLLWALSERWGVVTPHGVDVRLRLTHETLGRLVGARRPSVTTALGALAASGAVERTGHGFRLRGDAGSALRQAGGAAAAA